MGREIISTCHNFPIPFHRRHVFGLQTLNVPENDSYYLFYHILSTFLSSVDAPHSHDQLSQIGIFWVSLKKRGGAMRSHDSPQDVKPRPCAWTCMRAPDPEVSECAWQSPSVTRTTPGKKWLVFPEASGMEATDQAKRIRLKNTGRFRRNFILGFYSFEVVKVLLESHIVSTPY